MSLLLALRVTLGILLIVTGYCLALSIGLVLQVGISAVWHLLLAFFFTTLHSQGFAAGVAFTVLVIGCFVLIALRALMGIR